MPLTVGSLFSGIEGFGLALESAGMSVQWSVELDPSCRRVTAKHFSNAEQFDNITTVGKHNLKPVDILCGGFPCQGASVAGQRGGLADERTGLWWEMLRVCRELRPRVLLWENVPGLLSVNGGRDFAAILLSLRECGYFGCVRTLDAQFFGVPQRRRRLFGVFLAGDFAVGRAAEILALRKSGSGNSQASRTTGQGIADTLGGGSGKRGWADDTDRMTFVETGEGHSHFKQSDQSASFRGSGGGGINAQLVSFAADVAAPVTAGYAKSGFNDGAKRGVTPQLIASTLRSRQHSPGVSAPGRGGEDDANLVVGPLGTRHSLNGHGAAGVNDQEVNSGHLVIPLLEIGCGATTRGGGPNGVGIGESGDPMFTLQSGHQHGIGVNQSVRRLTPTECLRLQGFSDDWLDLDPALSDSAKYRMVGNAVAVPVVEWIGRRIVECV